MSDPTPLKPSSSTVASALAGGVTSLVLWGLNTFVAIQMTPEAAAGLTTIIAIAAGYFLPGGRHADTE